MLNGAARKILGAGLPVAVLAAGALPVPTAAQTVASPRPAADPRPNILIIYTDDVSRNQERLWCDGERTPTLARFCDEGVEFTNAVASTPLCGPARAALLTGQHGYHNGVTGNTGGLDVFDPSVSIATELQDAGYHTLFAGKHINGISVRTKKEVRELATGWDEFDVIWRRAGKKEKHFLDYRMWSRDGVLRHGTKPGDHATRVATERLVRHIKAAPADEPVFALASLPSGHVPNTPLARYEDAKACKKAGRWRGPSYNEADVSDKPAYVAEQPRLQAKGYPLRDRCEEMLTVDWATRKLLGALEATGRLDDTLVVFTSDNGYLLGDHRRPEGKAWPYALPVHLQMLWPAALGGEHREVAEPVSNVDFAPTFCELAGCEMPDTDGLSLLPLITGEAESLDRPFIYTEVLQPAGSMPAWYGLQTTGSFSEDASWVYTEYQTGERELYDVTADPFRLENLARLPEQADRLEALGTLLHEQVIEPNGISFGER